eukprot:403372887
MRLSIDDSISQSVFSQQNDLQSTQATNMSQHQNMNQSIQTANSVHEDYQTNNQTTLGINVKSSLVSQDRDRYAFDKVINNPAVQLEKDILRDIARRRQLTPDINKLLQKQKNSQLPSNSFVDRRKSQIQGQKLLQNIMKEVHNQNRSIKIGDNRMIRLMSEFDEIKSLSSMGQYVRQFQ